MDKSCANHPESMALATCKACDKSVCLMCVVDEKEGTFCSTECHTAFSNGQEVPKFVGAAAESASSSPGVQKIESIFDDEPAADSASSSGLPPAPSEEAMPIVAEGTKWRSIGAQCDNHADTPAVANCDRCGKPVCALCLLEASQGTFCSAECLGSLAKQPAAQPAAAERAALQGKPVFHFKDPPKTFGSGKKVALVLFVLLLAGGGYYGWVTLSPEAPPRTSQNPPDNLMIPPVRTPEIVKRPDPPRVDTPPPETKQPDPVVKTPVPPKVVTPPEISVSPLPTPKPKPVKIVILQTRTVNPWTAEEPGTWYRLRCSRGGTVTYTDTGLKEKGQGYFVLATQTWTNGQASAVSETRTEAPTVYLHGEESFTFDDRRYLCEIRSTGPDESAPRTWALLSGKNMGAVMKGATSEGMLTAKRVWEHTLRVKNRALDCLVVEAEVENGGKSGSVKSWYCGSIPLGVIQQEKPGESSALIDLGSDWSKRPPFPAP